MKLTIELTKAEVKAFQAIYADPQVWAENAVKERARIAMESIFQQEVQRMASDPSIKEIPADRDAVVLAYVIPPLVEPAIPTIAESA